MKNRDISTKYITGVVIHYNISGQTKQRQHVL